VHNTTFPLAAACAPGPAPAAHYQVKGSSDWKPLRFSNLSANTLAVEIAAVRYDKQIGIQKFKKKAQAAAKAAAESASKKGKKRKRRVQRRKGYEVIRLREARRLEIPAFTPACWLASSQLIAKNHRVGEPIKFANLHLTFKLQKAASTVRLPLADAGTLSYVPAGALGDTVRATIEEVFGDGVVRIAYRRELCVPKLLDFVPGQAIELGVRGGEW
jgi:hypothetical protein